MKQMNTAVEEIRSAKHKLMAKHYIGKGAIEIRRNGETIILTFPVGTPVQIYHGIDLFI